jgi:hypothetical protein
LKPRFCLGQSGFTITVSDPGLSDVGLFLATSPFKALFTGYSCCETTIAIWSRVVSCFSKVKPAAQYWQ